MFGSWFPSDAAVAEAAKGATSKESESPNSGGTSHLLPAERKRASFDVLELTHFLDGGAKATKRRRWIWKESDQFDNAHNTFLERSELHAQHVQRFVKVHKTFSSTFIPTSTDVMWMSAATRNGGAFSLHYGAFCPTILSQGTDEQKMEWLLPAMQMKIFGCLAQTELGHGSNVRALQTTATYDRMTQEFVLHSPTLRALKWWPGGLGKTATHSIVYAQLLLDGKEYGFHSFMLQLRDENHKPLPGIELGEVGPKIGDNFTETGFMRLTHVRIPRKWMLMKNQQVTEAGVYVKTKKPGDASSDKAQYSTMLAIRSALVIGAGYRLAQGVTIAARYSCVRQQGFVDTSAGSRLAPENPIIEYQAQQQRVLGQLALAYAMMMTGKRLSSRFLKLRTALNEGGDVSDLPEMHATSAGLKALCTFEAAAGLEECRKCCGGHGVLLASGVSSMAQDYVTYCTAEGDRIILELQSARFLVKSFGIATGGKGGVLSGACRYLEVLREQKTDQVKDEVLVRDWAHARSPQDFMAHDVLVALFRARALCAVTRASRRFLALVRDGRSRDKAWNECAVDLVHASRAHCFFVMLSAFVDGCDTAECPNAAVRGVLSNVCSLFGLLHLQEQAGDWVGLISSEQLLHVRSAVRTLLATLRRDIIPLTDAFEFPDNVLNSALGKFDGKVYEALYESARTSPLNSVDPFPGYVEHLRPILDLDFIRSHAALVRSEAGVAVTSKL